MLTILQNIGIIIISFVVFNSCNSKVNSLASDSAEFSKIETAKISKSDFRDDPAQEVVKEYYNLARAGKFSILKNLVEIKQPNEKSKASTKKQNESNEENQPKKDAPNPALLNELKLDYLLNDLPGLIREGHWNNSKIETLENKSNLKTVKIVLIHQIDPSYQIAILFQLFQNEKAKWKIFEAYFTDVKENSDASRHINGREDADTYF